MSAQCTCPHSKAHYGFRPSSARRFPPSGSDAHCHLCGAARAVRTSRALGGSIQWLLCHVAAASTLGAQVLHADTLRVPSDYPTIQSAIQAAAPEDTILVGPGLYDENLDTLDKRLILIGEAGAKETIVDGGQRARVLTMSGGGVVEGFTLTGGYHQYTGGGLRVEGWPASTIVRSNIIRNNVVGEPDGGQGGGIYLYVLSSATVESNEIRDNYAGEYGGGIFDGSHFNSLVRNNVISGNGVHLRGGGAWLLGATFIGNLVTDNWSDHFGGGVSGGIEIRNNTIVRNLTYNPLGAAVDAGNSDPIVANNIVVLNGATGISGVRCETLECNDSWGNDGGDYAACDTTGGRNFSADPLFCNEFPGDYRISEQSPCAPAENPGCGLVGAFPIGCAATPVQPTTWGRIKMSFR